MTSTPLAYSVVCLHLISYTHMTLGGGVPYVNQMKSYKALFPSGNASFPPTAQLKFGKYLVQFVNGTLRMGTESFEFVGENDEQIHGKSFRIASDKLMIGNDTLVPRDGKEVLLVNGVTMQPDGTLVAGPEQRVERVDTPNCNVVDQLCGAFFGECCSGYYCWNNLCRNCTEKKEKVVSLLPCKSDDECESCYSGSAFCTPALPNMKTKFCCKPAGQSCEHDNQCCENSYCDTTPTHDYIHGRCRYKVDQCIDGASCLRDTDCCAADQCVSGKCRCKLGQHCGYTDDCCRGEICKIGKYNGTCVCMERAECKDGSECCESQVCFNNRCRSCKIQNEPCITDDDCCLDGHCHRGHCRINFVKDYFVKYAHSDFPDFQNIPFRCLYDNVNAGLGGEFVFLCPIYTKNAAQAATGFYFEIGDCKDNTLNYLPDLAKGDNTGNSLNTWGSICRYLHVEKKRDSLAKVCQVGWSRFPPDDEDRQQYVTAGNVNEGRDANNSFPLFLNWRLCHLDPKVDFKSNVRENGSCHNDHDCGLEGHCHSDNQCRINYIKNIEVFYGDPLTINPYEIHLDCLETNINQNMGGKYVFICPVYTTVAVEAAVEFRLQIDDCFKNFSNLVEGTNEKCRYLHPVIQKEGPRIYEIEYSNSSIFPPGSDPRNPKQRMFQGTVGNINEGRLGVSRERPRELYFNWRKAVIPKDARPPFKDYECGSAYGDSICKGQYNGTCCSKNGSCGLTDNHCGDGCQAGYGSCTAFLPSDFRCGPSQGDFPCKGQYSAACCSQNGFCGYTEQFCGDGCQYNYGTCTEDSGRCGDVANKHCTGVHEGECCSSSGFCGTTEQHCGAGCQTNWGRCGIQF